MNVLAGDQRVTGYRKTVAISALLVAGVVLGGMALTSARTDKRQLRPDDRAIVRQGLAIYATQCASCHGKNLEGQADWRRRDEDGYLPAPPHDSSGHTWHHSDAQLFELTKHGLAAQAGADYKTRMPSYNGILSDREIIAVLSFIKSRWPANIRKRHDRLNAARR